MDARKQVTLGAAEDEGVIAKGVKKRSSHIYFTVEDAKTIPRKSTKILVNYTEEEFLKS